jgi:phospho-N-acetylmuramoyl-pentapeptide-transferase
MSVFESLVLGRAFESPATRAVLGLVLAFLATVFVGRRAIALLRRIGIEEPTDKGDSETLRQIQHRKGPVPTMGGLILLFGTTAPVLLLGDLSNPLLPLGLLAFVGFALTGLLDDYLKIRPRGARGLSVRWKLAFQLLLSVALAFALRQRELALGIPLAIEIPFTEHRLDLGGEVESLLYVAFLALTIVGASNAVNLSDGLDGLASGLTVIAGIPLVVLAAAAATPLWAGAIGLHPVAGLEELPLLAASIVGSTLGFLWFNCYPAEVILGDTGALALGAALGFCACAARIEVLLLVLAAPFVAEALSVMLQVGSYKLFHQRIFRCAPVHHHFQFAGLHEAKVTARFWIVGLLLGLLGLVWGPLW